MIKCLIFSCPTIRGNPCCAYCDKQEECPNRCENHPDRCRCWRDEPAGQRRVKRRTLYDSRRVVELFREGWTYDQIAAEMKCGRSTVTLILRKAGVLPHRGPSIDYDMVHTLHDYGLTNKEIAKRLNCSQASVSIILHQKRRPDDG